MRQNSPGGLLIAVLAIVGVTYGATTFDALKSEIAAAEEGGMVYVENDMEYSSTLGTIAKAVTIRSPEGQTNVLTRASGYTNGALLSLDAATADVTFADVVIDGNKAAGQQSGRLVYMTAGTVTIDAGCELRNVRYSSDGAILVQTAGTLVMNDGAVMRGFVNANWGTCVEIRTGGRFEMHGGLITENESLSGNDNAGYGGAVYVYGGRFYMYGGLITGNTATHATAGVANYSGRFYLYGDASITNNHGGIASDIGSYGSSGAGGFVMFDVRRPWTGWATLSRKFLPGEQAGGNVDTGWVAYIDLCDEFTPGTSVMSGLGHLSIEGHPEYVANGYGRNIYDQDDGGGVTNRYGSVMFAKRYFNIGSERCATLNEAVDLMRDGDVVELCGNFSLAPTASLVVPEGVNITLRSGDGGPYTFKRPGGYVKNWEGKDEWKSYKLMEVSNATVRVENLFLDGGGWGPELLLVRAGGSLTLGAGAVVQNVGSRAFNIQGRGANAVMESGSVISNCHTTGSGSYGSAALIGVGGNPSPLPKLTMTGGLITNCTVEGALSGSYGGVVYTWGGEFEMSGGSIVGNVNTNTGPSGIYCYSGNVRIGGTARIVDNVGVLPDLYGAAKIFGDYRGCAGVCRGNMGLGQTSIVTLEAGATGAWCLHPSAAGADRTLTGVQNGTSVVWANAIARIDDVGFASAEDLALGRPTSIDVDADALPHVYSGTALAAGGTMTVAFDSEARFAAADYPVTLMTAEGGSFSGSWRFALPEAPKGKWSVARTGTAFVLTWSPKESLIIVR